MPSVRTRRARSTVVATFMVAMLLGSRAARAQEDSQASDADAPTTPHPAAATEAWGKTLSAYNAAARPKPFSFTEPFAWPQAVSRVDVDGYVLPQFEYVSLPSALPRDQTQYGARGSRAGFALHGTPIEGWSYLVHVVVFPAGTESLALLSPTPTPPASSVTVSTATGTAIDVEEATVTYRPVEWYLAKLGVVRIPFSPAEETPVPAQMFPFRAAQTTAFQNGADVGFLNTLPLFDARLQANVGVFLGSSLGTFSPTETVRGVAVAGSIEAHPLGAMSLREGDEKRGPLRVALGGGAIYRAATSYDATGYEASHFADSRVDVSVRASWRGLYVQGEYLRHLQTDDLSGRPVVDSGGYGEASYYQPVGPVALEPLFRAGTLSANEQFAERSFTSYEGGLAFYPNAGIEEPWRLRVLAEYIHAAVSPLTEIEHEGLVQLQLEW